MNGLVLFVAVVSLAHASPCADTTTPEPVTSAWPQGSYALPMPVTGCPEASWTVGGRYQDTEDYLNGNFYNSTNLSGFPKFDGIFYLYCAKSTSGVDSAPWPAGSYCIGKKNSCPAGFQEGSILWDDENNFNMNIVLGGDSSSLPDGLYDYDTLMYFCCREDGPANVPVSLPTDVSFFLLMKGSECQEVAGMSVSLETVVFDDEDNGNIDATTGSTPTNVGNSINQGLGFCHYTQAAVNILMSN